MHTTPAMDVRAHRAAAYSILTMVLALGAIFTLAGSTWSSEDVYLPLACALAVGMLLTVRQSPGHPGAALVLIPAMAVDARLGLTALPAVLIGSLATNLFRGVRGYDIVISAGHMVLAFTAAHFAAQNINQVPDWAAFAVVFAATRFGLWHFAHWMDHSMSHPRGERPDLVLSLTLAPVGVLPLIAADRLGDGALLLAMAALLALLFVVRESVNLATLRAETEAERDRLARANALQDDLIHLITHELRNPLTLVMSYAQMTRRAALDGSTEQIPTYVANVERAGKSIQRLMENMLQLSKLERSDTLPPAEPVQLASVVNQVVVDLAPLAKQKEQTLIVQPVRDVRPALAVPLLLREALSNLVSNAVKYTPEGGEITVWGESSSDGSTVILGVRDTGIGLGPDDLKRLFTKFFRSSDKRVQKERGSGLGLALTHAMVCRMGGRIDVESTLGQGTTFRVTLPAAKAA
jgi:signal transduction histidine kinase